MIVYRLKFRKFLFPTIIVASVFILLILLVHNNSQILDYASSNKNKESPGSYLSQFQPKDDSFCNFKFGLPEEFLYEESDLNSGPEEGEKSPYRVIYNVIESGEIEGVPKVAYATPMTVGFINYIPEIVRFWDGYVSVSLFVPDFDADLAIRVLDRICRCSEDMKRVSVHLVFPEKVPPYLQIHQPDERTCNLPDLSNLPTFKSQNSLKYPINVCRNSARLAAVTDLVLVADCELMPSEKLAERFLRMLEDYSQYETPSRVYVVPVFEVDSEENLPRTKGELVGMIKREKAVYFHRHVCSHCQKFPAMKYWTETAEESVKPLATVKREHPFNRWEPIYIGTKSEPFYSEALSWEGLQDKMTQMDEMCLIGYRFVILDGAFLVHWPGMKKKKKFPSWRMKFKKENSKEYTRITSELIEKYHENRNCKVGGNRTYHNVPQGLVT